MALTTSRRSVSRARPQSAGGGRCGAITFPLLVRGVACIAQMIAPILRARDFSPGQGVLLGVFANTRESQPLKSRNPFGVLMLANASSDRGGSQTLEETYTIVLEAFRVSL